MSSAPMPRPPMSGGKTALVVIGSVIGGAVVLCALVYVAFTVTAPEKPTPPSPRQVAASLCSAVAADPAGDRYSVATRLYPPDRDLGRVGTAVSYREAARAIDGFCPEHYEQAELLRGMARIYDPSGG